MSSLLCEQKWGGSSLQKACLHDKEQTCYLQSSDFYFSTERPDGSPASWDAANRGSSSAIPHLLKLSPSYLQGSGGCTSWPLSSAPPLSFVKPAKKLDPFSSSKNNTRKSVLEGSQNKKNLFCQHSSQSCVAENRFRSQNSSVETPTPSHTNRVTSWSHLITSFSIFTCKMGWPISTLKSCCED